MQITLVAFPYDTPDDEEAQGIVQKCVRCGFCTAACPTYQLFGDELGGPHGRIYLMKQVLGGRPTGATTHLRPGCCPTCRSCESVCPSGMIYGRLVEIGRKIVDDQLDTKGESCPLGERTVRWVSHEEPTRPALFGFAFRPGQVVRPMLPLVLYNRAPAGQSHASTWPGTTYARKMLLLEDCV